MGSSDSRLGARVRAARTAKGLSIKALAELTGLTSSLISQFERGMAGISLVSLRQIAQALDLSLGSLFDDVRLHIVRRAERQQILGQGAAVPVHLVSPDFYRTRIVECRLQPGQATSHQPRSHLGQECTVVVTGHVRAFVAEEVCDLREGDSLTIDSHQLHKYVNIGDGEALLIMVMTANDHRGAT